jgi:hypothetical protein
MPRYKYRMRDIGGMPSEKYAGRVATIYFDTTEERTEIIKAAQVADVSFACYCREMIRRGMAIDPTPDVSTIRELRTAKEDLSRLRHELKDRVAEVKHLETEIFNLKHSLFLQPQPSGQSTLSSELVDLLQDGHTWPSHEIMKALNIDQKNIDAIKILAEQLHALQDLHLVVEGSKGWKWVA